MNNRNDNKSVNRGNSAFAAFATHKISKKEKRAWMMVGIAILFLLLCWWARSF
jgi:hypothetical protein